MPMVLCPESLATVNYSGENPLDFWRLQFYTEKIVRVIDDSWKIVFGKACTICQWCCVQKVWLLSTIQGKIHWTFGGYSFIQNKLYRSLMNVETWSRVKWTLEPVLYANGVVFRKFGY